MTATKQESSSSSERKKKSTASAAPRSLGELMLFLFLSMNKREE